LFLNGEREADAIADEHASETPRIHRQLEDSLGNVTLFVEESSGMARSDLERYNDTYKYLHTVSSELALHVDQQVASRNLSKGELGRALSLKGIWSKGHLYRGQHWAMRALMLCHAIYLTSGWARQRENIRELKEGRVEITGFRYVDFPLLANIDVPTSIIRNMSESQIKKMILGYVPVGGVSADDLAQAAESAVEDGMVDFRTLTRDAPCKFRTCICYDGVRLWLFKAGFVSIRWLTREGPSLMAHTANEILGNGTVIGRDQLKRMPRGYIFNFHGGTVLGRDNKDVCHWGISLGGGLGAATNTTASENDRGRTVAVNFIRGAGAGQYGVFRLKESYDVCALKYSGDRGCETVIRQIDPQSIDNLY